MTRIFIKLSIRNQKEIQMVLFFPFLILLSVANASLINRETSRKMGACFYRKSSKGCQGFIGFMTRNECCRYGGFFVRNPDSGQLFLAVMINTNTLPNCENSCGIDYCNRKECNQGDTCIMREYDSICSSDCTCTKNQQESGHVCLENGPKYRNMCDLHLKSCLTNTKPTIIQCKRSGCDRNICGERPCVLTLEGKSKCIDTVKNCEGVVYGPLCGVDNITYPSLCHITKAGIERSLEIHIAYKGICRESATCSNVECPNTEMSCVKHHSNSSPVCLKCPGSMEECYNPKYRSDELFCLSINRQSQNTCYKDFLSCQNNVFVEIIHSGLCLQIVKLPLQNL